MDRDEKECIKVIGEKTRRNEPIGVCRSRWNNNIKIDVKEIGGVVLVGLIWFRRGTSGWLL
jgi:hypothetical protein